MLALADRATPAPMPAPLPLALHHLRPRDGHPDWGRLHREALDLAATLGPLQQRPVGGMRDRRRRLRAQATAARNYLVNRRRAREGREDLLPLYFIWTLLRACNFSCTYCDDHQGHKYPDLPPEGTLDTAAALRLLEIMRTGTASVYFAGGEPTLRADLPELTRAAWQLDYHPIIINTNGSAIDRMLRKPGWRGWLAGTDVVVVSLDGVAPGTLGEMWRYRRPEDVLRNLLLLRELSGPLGFKLMINTVIQPGHLEHARDAFDLAADLGVWFCPVPMNVGPRVDERLGDDPAYQTLIADILARKRAGHRITGSVRLNQRLLSGAPLSCRNTLKPHIDHDGTLFWPCKASVNVTPEKIRVLDFPDVASLWAHASALVDPTRFHGPARNQCGADCNWAQNYTTDAYAHGLRHPLGLLGEVAGLLRDR